MTTSQDNLQTKEINFEEGFVGYKQDIKRVQSLLLGNLEKQFAYFLALANRRRRASANPSFVPRNFAHISITY